MKRLIFFGLIVSVILTSAWYFDIFHGSVEVIDELIGKNYEYSYKKYFKTDPDFSYTININDPLNEFHGAISEDRDKLIDSIVHVYTWNYFTHSKTIWIGKTRNINDEVIDAIRYKNDILF